MSTTKQINSWDWDVRVRERNLKKGALTDKDVDKMLGHLPDLTESSEAVAQPQPALGGREE